MTQARDLLTQMTLEEKAALCSGRDFWNLKGIERLGIPSIMLTDGPHGLRKQTVSGERVDLNASVPTTCFPTATALAATWNRDLVYRVGEALAQECLAEKVAILLGPGANIKRSPLCGRNFEYFSEDPYLTGEMAKAHIRGVQSKGIGTALKHYAVNNQESRRMSIDAIVDERALREIYLTGFEIAVRGAQPAAVMCAYNRRERHLLQRTPASADRNSQRRVGVYRSGGQRLGRGQSAGGGSRRRVGPGDARLARPERCRAGQSDRSGRTRRDGPGSGRGAGAHAHAALGRCAERGRLL